MPRLRQRGKVGSPKPTKLSSQADSSMAGSTAGSTALPNPSYKKKTVPRPVPAETVMAEAHDESRPLLSGQTNDEPSPTMVASSWTARNQWIVLALASGGCAAFNGVFAKLYVVILCSVHPVREAHVAMSSSVVAKQEVLVLVTKLTNVAGQPRNSQRACRRRSLAFWAFRLLRVELNWSREV